MHVRAALAAFLFPPGCTVLFLYCAELLMFFIVNKSYLILRWVSNISCRDVAIFVYNMCAENLSTVVLAQILFKIDEDLARVVEIVDTVVNHGLVAWAIKRAIQLTAYWVVLIDPVLSCCAVSSLNVDCTMHVPHRDSRTYRGTSHILLQPLEVAEGFGICSQWQPSNWCQP